MPRPPSSGLSRGAPFGAPARAVRRVRRAVLARRRLLATVCVAVAVLAGLRAQAAPPPARTPVVTAAHDLPAGTVLRLEDLRSSGFDPESVPSGVLGVTAVVGRTTTTPVRAGEPFTGARLVSRSLLDGYPGLVAVPVRIGDPGAVRLLRVGDRVDVLAADPRGGDGGSGATTVGSDVPVLALPRAPSGGDGLVQGALVVLAVPRAEAARLAQAAVTSFLSVVLTH